MDFKLNKDEKLCSRTAVNLLFDEGKSLMAFPLRAAYRLRPQGNHPLNRRDLLLPALKESDWGVDIAFVYLDTTPAPYSVIQEKITLLLQRIAHAATQQPATPQAITDKPVDTPPLS